VADALWSVELTSGITSFGCRIFGDLGPGKNATPGSAVRGFEPPAGRAAAVGGGRGRPTAGARGAGADVPRGRPVRRGLRDPRRAPGPPHPFLIPQDLLEGLSATVGCFQDRREPSQLISSRAKLIQFAPPILRERAREIFVADCANAGGEVEGYKMCTLTTPPFNKWASSV